MQKYLIPLSQKNSAHMAAQIEKWRHQRIEKAPLEVSPFITISRQFGCGAYPLAEAIADKLSQKNETEQTWAVYDRALVQRIADDHQLSQDLVTALGEEVRSEFDESLLGLLKGFTPELKIYRSMVSTVRALTMHGRVIIVGRGSAILTREFPGGLHIRLIAPKDWRIKSTMETFKMTLKEARKYVSRMDGERESFIRKYLDADVADPHHYHMIFNNAKMRTNIMVDAIVGAIR